MSSQQTTIADRPASPANTWDSKPPSWPPCWLTPYSHRAGCIRPPLRWLQPPAAQRPEDQREQPSTTPAGGFPGFYAQRCQPTTMSLALGYSWLPPAPRPLLAAQHSGLPAWPPTAPRWPSSRRLIGRRPCTREVNVCHSARSDILPSDRVRCSKCELLQ